MLQIKYTYSMKLGINDTIVNAIAFNGENWIRDGRKNIKWLLVLKGMIAYVKWDKRRKRYEKQISKWHLQHLLLHVHLHLHLDGGEALTVFWFVVSIE